VFSLEDKGFDPGFVLFAMANITKF